MGSLNSERIIAAPFSGVIATSNVEPDAPAATLMARTSAAG